MTVVHQQSAVTARATASNPSSSATLKVYTAMHTNSKVRKQQCTSALLSASLAVVVKVLHTSDVG
jgi:hypothetical protein